MIFVKASVGGCNPNLIVPFCLFLALWKWDFASIRLPRRRQALWNELARHLHGQYSMEADAASGRSCKLASGGFYSLGVSMGLTSSSKGADAPETLPAGPMALSAQLLLLGFVLTALFVKRQAQYTSDDREESLLGCVFMTATGKACTRVRGSLMPSSLCCVQAP